MPNTTRRVQAKLDHNRAAFSQYGTKWTLRKEKRTSIQRAATNHKTWKFHVKLEYPCKRYFKKGLYNFNYLGINWKIGKKAESKKRRSFNVLTGALKQKNRKQLRFSFVPTTGVEPARPYEHYPLKVACLPIPPRGPLEF